VQSWGREKGEGACNTEYCTPERKERPPAETTASQEQNEKSENSHNTSNKTKEREKMGVETLTEPRTESQKRTLDSKGRERKKWMGKVPFCQRPLSAKQLVHSAWAVNVAEIIICESSPLRTFLFLFSWFQN